MTKWIFEKSLRCALQNTFIDKINIYLCTISECSHSDGHECDLHWWDADQESQKFCVTMFCMHEVGIFELALKKTSVRFAFGCFSWGISHFQSFYCHCLLFIDENESYFVWGGKSDCLQDRIDIE